MTRVERLAKATALALGVSLGVPLFLAAPARAQEVNLARLEEGPANGSPPDRRRMGVRHGRRLRAHRLRRSAIPSFWSES